MKVSGLVALLMVATAARGDKAPTPSSYTNYGAPAATKAKAAPAKAMTTTVQTSKGTVMGGGFGSLSGFGGHGMMGGYGSMMGGMMSGFPGLMPGGYGGMMAGYGMMKSQPQVIYVKLIRTKKPKKDPFKKLKGWFKKDKGSKGGKRGKGAKGSKKGGYGGGYGYTPMLMGGYGGHMGGMGGYGLSMGGFGGGMGGYSGNMGGYHMGGGIGYGGHQGIGGMGGMMMGGRW